MCWLVQRICDWKKDLKQKRYYHFSVTRTACEVRKKLSQNKNNCWQGCIPMWRKGKNNNKKTLFRLNAVHPNMDDGGEEVCVYCVCVSNMYRLCKTKNATNMTC